MAPSVRAVALSAAFALSFAHGQRAATIATLLAASACLLPFAQGQGTTCEDAGTIEVVVTVPISFNFDATTTGGLITLLTADPAPGLSAPGSYSCTGCPDSVTPPELSINVNDTVLPVSGVVTGVTGDGIWYLEKSGVGKRQVGQEAVSSYGSIATDVSTGEYSFSAPLFCGAQTLKRVWSNGAGQYVIVTEIVAGNCEEAAIRVTLTWTEIGNDWDLHLIRPGGACLRDFGDCFYGNRNPDWEQYGNPQLDIDCIRQCTTENIFLGNPGAGTYEVRVVHYSGGWDFPGSVFFNVLGQHYSYPLSSLPQSGDVLIGTIDWPSGAVHLNGGINQPCTNPPQE